MSYNRSIIKRNNHQNTAVADTNEATTPSQPITENTPAAIKDKAETTKPDEATRSKKVQIKGKVNLLYEQCLGFIPVSLAGKRDPGYVYAKFPKEYKGFDYTHENLLQILEEANLLQYLELLQISKPKKSIDAYFSTADAAQFSIDKHVEIRGKPILFIWKANRILRVTINGIHPDLTDDELRAELYQYVENISTIRHRGRNY